MTVTKQNWEDILAAAKGTDVVAIKCVYNVDSDGEVQDCLKVGETYYATYSGADDLDIFESDVAIQDVDPIWDDFNGHSYQRYKFFVLADAAITAEVDKAVTELEAVSTDELITAYKKLKVDEKAILEVLKARLKGLPL